MSFIVEAFFSGCISKVINDGKDYSWSKIKSVIKDRHDQNISTKICRVIEKSLNIVTDNAYKNSDKLYDAIEKIFNNFKNHNDTLESVKCGLNVLGAEASDQRCENFLEKFYEGIRSDDDLYKAIMMDLELKDIKISQEEFQKLNEKIDNLTELVSSRNNNENDLQKREPVKSRTQEYADKWNQNMFLNDFDEWDEKAGVNVKLKDVYLEDHLPHFIWKNNKNISTNLKSFLSKYIYEKDENKMLLILGQPGIGKSTLITWIAANFTDKADDILVYRFASDLRDCDWQSARLLNRILEKLGFDYEDLNRKTIILDGLDEVSINNRREVLDGLYDNLIYKNSIKEFSLIITCRENYVQERDRNKGTYIILQSWDETQIRSFRNVFEEKTKIGISENTLKKIIESKDILGIPLILYMVLALNISVEKEGSIVDVYDKIFSLDGGIYDRCINNKNFADKHRIGEIKEQIHQISRDIAIWMFENKSEEAYIPGEEYQKICDNIVQNQEQNNSNIKQDFLIGNFFKLVKHCEGVDLEELYFVHRSIYEYFVVETIYSSIEKAIMDLTEKSQEDLAKNIAFYLKEGKISTTIGEYLQHKIIKLYNKMDDEKKQRFYLWWESTVDKMMDTGMFYYTNRNIHEYKDIIEKEINCFSNLMDILRLILVITDRKYIMESVNTSRLVGYITLKKRWHNLNKVYLENADLRGAKLHEFNLQEANLCNADLERTDLVGANLQKADLQEADLRGALFYPSQLEKAILKGAKFDRKQIIELERQELDLQEVKVFSENKKCFINYEEYRKTRKQKANTSFRGNKQRIGTKKK